MSVFARDPHQEAYVFRIKLLGGQIIFERVGGLQLRIVKVALINEFLSRIGIDRCAWWKQHRDRENDFKESGFHDFPD